MTQHPATLLLTLSGELHTKSKRTRRWFQRVLEGNLAANLGRLAPEAELGHHDRHLTVSVPAGQVEAAAEALTSVFGVQRVHLVRPVPAGDLAGLAADVARIAGPSVAGRRFAVRVRRRGQHAWSSMDAQREIGTLLLDGSAGVDLDHPDVEVTVHVLGTTAFVVERSWDGPGGLPLGTQNPVLALLSGGFDSPVAAWMLMRRGSPAHFVHFQLDCAQSDHAIAVAHDVWRRWGSGASPLVWLVDFSAVKEALYADCPARLRQVVLKQLMFAAADRLAEGLDLAALVTGESVAQVSSQTLVHLAEIDRMVTRTVLRPLAGLDKTEIIDRARRIGTEALSARAKEVCDLSEGPVAIAARRATLDRARDALPGDLVAQTLATREVVALELWGPGQPLVPVLDRPPEGIAVVRDDERVPPEDPVVFAGDRAVHRASRLRRSGRDVYVLAGEAPAREDALPTARVV